MGWVRLQSEIKGQVWGWRVRVTDIRLGKD